MFKQFKIEQPIATKVLEQSINNNRLSHAYLFETNGYYQSELFINNLLKAILCPNHGDDNCEICRAIDDKNYIEIKHIYPDKGIIKKNQLIDLQKEFIKKAIIGQKKIYVIHNAEEMNQIAANSLLKFLEEPQENIIAILVCESVNKLLPTILSRLQVISLNGIKDKGNVLSEKIKNIFNTGIDIKKIVDITEIIINYINYYETNHMDTFSYNNQLFISKISDKEEMLLAFNIMIIYYKEVINDLLKRPLEFFEEYQLEIKAIAKNNSVKTIAKKIEIILKTIENKEYNANTGLLFDMLVLGLEEVK